MAHDLFQHIIFLWLDTHSKNRKKKMRDDPTVLDDFFHPYFAFLIIAFYAKYVIWQQFVNLIRKKKKDLKKQIIFLLCFFFVIIAEFSIFNTMIRNSWRYDVWFLFSIILPLGIFYFCLFKIMKGTYRSLKRGILKIKSVRIFSKYHKYISGIYISYAFAYSSVIGIVTSFLSFAESYYMQEIFPKPKKVKSKRQKQV